MVATFHRAPALASDPPTADTQWMLEMEANHHLKPREEAIEKLKSSLGRYTRSNDRRMVLRSLKEATFLTYVPLAVPALAPEVSIADLENELGQETIILNGFTVKSRSSPDKDGLLKNNSSNNECLMMIKGFVESFCGNKSSSCGFDANTLYKILVIRMAKTTASANPFFVLNSMVGSSDLILRTWSPKRKAIAAPADTLVKVNSYGSHCSQVSGTSNTKANDGNVIILNLYESYGEIHMTLDMTFELGLFRKTDAKSSRPWIAMQGLVHERANLSTGEGNRSMHVKTPNLY